ncbi:LmbE family N-acetylglucosaminyl deacetylase/SAM-dependent methyltransferase [Kineococcus radiotolerans]|uniref:LmbE family N-acetylglucosaminyl deacetylase/SAM-dependent methyltransferase n=1 Tax=Kineococcus radiotolerans TaxID=131568 RepID=A0A7W4TKD4_KINRA|nr:PIG-L family deacetylase [Kineococcus radiotolerans]MBB2900524.1 LmbE family N-acetylglucosaminyl deacetylase/SAM-dependent methyltransferase [Kineococcus radiotolerans]
MAVVNGDGSAGGNVAFTHDGAGTAEVEWARWPGLRDVPPLAWDGVAHVLVVAAHPDDETLGAGGLLATAAARGLPVDVLVLTDGEASHPDSPTTTPERLAAVRAAEVTRAVADLVPGAALHRRGLPDGTLTDAADDVRRAVADLVRPGTLVVSPWSGDAHPDHDTAGRVSADVARAAGVRCLQYPVWAWHWSHPGDHRVPWVSGVRLVLDGAVRGRKRNALDRHVSQTRPLSPQPGDEVLLPAAVTAHFERDEEFFLVAPADPGAPGDPASLRAEFFEEFYDAHGDDPWGFEDRWYEQRKRALTAAALPRARFRSALEIGCSAGVATVELAARCDRLLALDVAASAVRRARERVVAAGRGDTVETRVACLPREFPDGRFDLVVLSEVAYYCDPPDLRDLLDRITASLTADGVVVACHWRHLVADHPLTGDEVHRELRTTPGLAVLAHHEEEDFLLDVLVRPPVTSVARAGGLVP